MLTERIYDTLTYFGISQKSLGFHYIITGVQVFDPEMKSMELYELIARLYNTTPQKVERAITYAFSQMDYKSPEVQEYFGKKFTNIGYISILHWKLARGVLI